MSDEERVLDIVSGYTDIPREELSLSTTLEQVGLDSLEFIDLLLAIGEAFHTLSDDAIPRLDTIGSILRELEPANA